MMGAGNTSELKPKNTLYLKNLSRSVERGVLKAAIAKLFSQFGPITSLILLREEKDRGQAFVCFESIEAACDAMCALQGCNLFGYPLIISFARRNSYTDMKKDIATKGLIPATSGLPPNTHIELTQGQNVFIPTYCSHGTLHWMTCNIKVELKEAPLNPKHQWPATLCLQIMNYPIQTHRESHELLTSIFNQAPNFVEIHMFIGSNKLAIAEYETDEAAYTARKLLNGFVVTPIHLLSVRIMPKSFYPQFFKDSDPVTPTKDISAKVPSDDIASVVIPSVIIPSLVIPSVVITQDDSPSGRSSTNGNLSDVEMDVEN